MKSVNSMFGLMVVWWVIVIVIITELARARWSYARKAGCASSASSVEWEREQAACDKVKAIVRFYVRHRFFRPEEILYFRDDELELSCVSAGHLNDKEVIARTMEIFARRGWQLRTFEQFPYSRTNCFSLMPIRWRFLLRRLIGDKVRRNGKLRP